MAIKIKFDTAGMPERPTFVLATRGGERLGLIETATDIDVRDNLTSASEFSMVVHKSYNGVQCQLWDKITPMRLVWCIEWDKWFQIDIDIEESTEVVKHITATSLGEAELSQIYLYDVEINTEDDILRDDYVVTTIYNEMEPKASLLHRILDKAPHYRIGHVDPSIASIQRTFSFDSSSIYDAMQEVAEEVGCLFVMDSGSRYDGSIDRKIDVYDLQSACLDEACSHFSEKGYHYRGDFHEQCPICGSANIREGYGQDTTIFVSSENLSDDVRMTPNTDSVKNCFKLVAGDDLMTATIMNCNPNGSQYMWRITDEMREDMSDGLKAKLAEYDKLYAECVNEREIHLGVDAYNALVDKYSAHKDGLKKIEPAISGFSKLILALYDAIDFDGFLRYELMPEVVIGDTYSSDQVEAIVNSGIERISLANVSAGTSTSTVEGAIRLMVKSLVDTTRFSYEINTASWANNVSDGGDSVWTGTITVTKNINDGDDEDSSTSPVLTFVVDDDYENYVKQLIEKKAASYTSDDFTVTGLFKKSGDDFSTSLSQYSLEGLGRLHDCCQGILDVLIDSGCGDANSDTHDSIYAPYYDKLIAIDAEIDVRDAEVSVVEALQDEVDEARNSITSELNLQKYVGDEYWSELCSYRREDKYENSNYVSDGLSNDELFAMALEFTDNADKELDKASTVQHSISTTLKNLLVIPEFKKIVDYFQVGNWIRVRIDDVVCKLRLLSYEIDYDDLNYIQVEFSDVERTSSGAGDIASLMNSMSSIATSYDSIAHQVETNNHSTKMLSGWVNEGLSVTNTRIVNDNDEQQQTWDEHGILLKRYNPFIDKADDTQMKLVNRGLYITDDNWQTVKAAIGNYRYPDPETGKTTSAYGVLADTVIGKMVLGESLGIYNTEGSLKFDDNGLVATNGTNTVTINPNSPELFKVSKQNRDLIFFDDEGDANFDGHITAQSLSVGDKTAAGDGSDGLYIDSAGNLTAGRDGQTKIRSDGTFSLGGGDLTYDGATLKITGDGSGLDIASNGSVEELGNAISLKVSAEDYTGEKITSLINQSADTVSIAAQHITLEGIVTANDNFKVLKDGSIECKNASVSGQIEATSGYIGNDEYGFRINDNAIRHYQYFYDEDGAETERYDYFFQAPKFNDSTQTNVFAVRRSDDGGSSWDYPFRVNYTGDTYVTDLRATRILPRAKSAGGDGTLTINIGGENTDDQMAFYYSESLQDGGDNPGDKPSGDFVIQAMPGRTADDGDNSHRSNGFGRIGTSDHPFHYVRAKEMYATKMQVNGQNISSDKKIKEHQGYMSDDIAAVEHVFYRLKPAVYLYKDPNTLDDKSHMGFYAQDVHSLMREAYKECSFGLTTAYLKNTGDDTVIADVDNTPYDDDDLRWSLSYTELIAPTVAIVQRQHEEILGLREMVANLSKRLSIIEKSVNDNAKNEEVTGGVRV